MNVPVPPGPPHQYVGGGVPNAPPGPPHQYVGGGVLDAPLKPPPARQGTRALPYKLDAHFAPVAEVAIGKGRQSRRPLQGAFPKNVVGADASVRPVRTSDTDT